MNTVAQTSGSTVLVAAGAANLRKSAAELLRPAGFTIVEAAADVAPDVVLAVLDSDRLDLSAAERWLGDRERAVPLVVFGPAAGRVWRKQALESGAFACISIEAPEVERLSVVLAASRYRTALAEIEVIRRETEIVVQGLLKSYGTEAQKLRQVIEEANHVRESLEDVRNHIIRSML